MSKPRVAEDRVRPVRYSPPEGYALDVEVYRADELRRRAQTVERTFERIDFNVALYLTRGRYRHEVDFETHDLGAGSWLMIQPGQVHRFGDLTGWDGWLLIFRSEVLGPIHLADVHALPTHVRTTGRAKQSVTEVLLRMATDAEGEGSPALNALMRGELQALLLRLHMLATPPSEARDDPAVLERFTRYRAAVDREFRRWHAVGRYAKHLGCSEKSLNRATRRVADVSAKAFLTARIVLEAKRLLAHTLVPVALVADQLGFEEPTNFVKFFRRETGLTPGNFRRQSR